MSDLHFPVFIVNEFFFLKEDTGSRMSRQVPSSRNILESALPNDNH